MVRRSSGFFETCRVIERRYLKKGSFGTPVAVPNEPTVRMNRSHGNTHKDFSAIRSEGLREANLERLPGQALLGPFFPEAPACNSQRYRIATVAAKPFPAPTAAIVVN